MSTIHRWMPAGDSVTLGAGNAATVAECGFRSKLCKLLTVKWGTTPIACGRNLTGWMGPNNMAGMSGLTVAELDTWLAQDLAAFNPDVITLHVGTNDCTQLNSGGSPLLATSMASMTTLLTRIRSTLPTVKVYIAYIIPNVVATAEVVNYNAALKVLVEARADYASGLLVPVDIYAAFVANVNWAADYMADNSHSNQAGYTVMATTWNTAITA